MDALERKRFEEQLGRNIVTTHVYPPIPIRTMDWQAHLDGDEPDDDGRMMAGHGATEADAVKDLIERVMEKRDG